MDGLFDALCVQVSERGVTAVRFHDSAPETDRSAAPGPNGRWAASLRRDALRQLSEYLEGARTRFDLPLDLRAASPFRAAVLEELRAIPFGATASYGEIAGRIGCGSARAVGQAVGWNPVPILIPCHRVVTATGRLGGFSAGLGRKAALLRIEGIAVSGASFSSRLTVPA